MKAAAGPGQYINNRQIGTGTSILTGGRPIMFDRPEGASIDGVHPSGRVHSTEIAQISATLWGRGLLKWKIGPINDGLFVL